MDTMTVTRGLAELKLLDSRITKQVENSIFVDMYQKRNKQAMGAGIPMEEFEARAKEGYQSTVDLIKRRAAIKSAIMKSNATTLVTIGGEEMFVMDAIEMKNSIQYKQNLLSRMKSQQVTIKKYMDQNKSKLDEQVRELVEKNIGTERKIDPDYYKTIATPFIEANETKICDPLEIGKKIEEMDKSIDTFNSEVDFILSESNAKTEINI